MGYLFKLKSEALSAAVGALICWLLVAAHDWSLWRQSRELIKSVGAPFGAEPVLAVSAGQAAAPIGIAIIVFLIMIPIGLARARRDVIAGRLYQYVIWVYAFYATFVCIATVISERVHLLPGGEFSMISLLINEFTTIPLIVISSILGTVVLLIRKIPLFQKASGKELVCAVAALLLLLIADQALFLFK